MKEDLRQVVSLLKPVLAQCKVPLLLIGCWLFVVLYVSARVGVFKPFVIPDVAMLGLLIAWLPCVVLLILVAYRSMSRELATLLVVIGLVPIFTPLMLVDIVNIALFFAGSKEMVSAFGPIPQLGFGVIWLAALVYSIAQLSGESHRHQAKEPPSFEL